MSILWCLLVITRIYLSICDFQSEFGNPSDLIGDLQSDDYSFQFHNNFILDADELKKFENLSPAESKSKFSEIIDKMDSNNDGMISLDELRDWVGKVHSKTLSKEVDKQWKSILMDNNNDISFDQYSAKTFGDKLTEAHESFLITEKRKWIAADLNKDKLLNKTEFGRFLHPEEFADLKLVATEELMWLMDTNKDSVIDMDEYLSEIFPDIDQTNKQWLKEEKETFRIVRDINRDGILDIQEVQKWLLPGNYGKVDYEVERIIDLADVDKNQILTKSEMMDKYQILIGTENTEEASVPNQWHEEL